MTPVPIVAMMSAVIVGAVGVGLSHIPGWNFWYAATVAVPILIFGIWLDGYLWDRAFKKHEGKEMKETGGEQHNG